VDLGLILEGRLARGVKKSGSRPNGGAQLPRIALIEWIAYFWLKVPWDGKTLVFLWLRILKK